MTVSGGVASGISLPEAAGGGIYNSAGMVAVTNSSINGNTADLRGGGIFNAGGITTIASSTFRNNTSVQAGALWNTGTMVIADSTVSNNTAAEECGGVRNVRNVRNGTVTITDSFISDNTVTNGDGGGICNSGATVIISKSDISSNFAGGDGGGIFNNSGDLVTVTDINANGNTSSAVGGGIRIGRGSSTVNVVDSTVSRNTAYYAGVIDNTFGDLTITGSTISGNTATIGDCGGIWTWGTVVIANSTISRNTVDLRGGAVTISSSTIADNIANVGFGGLFNDTESVLTLGNSIIAMNSALTNPHCGSSVTSLGHNLIGDATDSGFIPMTGDLVGSAATPIDHLVGPLQDNGSLTETRALLNGSVAIDAGDVATCPIIDQRGFPLPRDRDDDDEAVCDIGA